VPVALGVAVVVAAPAEALASRTVAFYSMDEAPGSRVLLDSSGNGRNGTIGTDVTSGAMYQGATAHRFATHLPEDGAFPGHVDRIPNAADLNPDSGDFSIEVRLRTSYRFGNILQKGQGATAGGYWKLENPEGLPRCLFRGGNGASRTGYSTVPINDGQWHTIRCNRTSTFVEMFIDGVRQSRLTGPTGTISNTWELTVGGKGACDGVTVTCDYFVGDIDYVRIEKGSGGAPNVPPVADAAVSCVGLICALSGAGSSDSDGAIQRYLWDFGDGTTYDGVSSPSTSHTYAAAGSYTVTLTVTDDRGATASTTRAVSVAPVPEKLSFVGQATSNVNATIHQVVVPASVQPGDALLLFVSQNTQATLTGPTGVTGWTQLGSAAQGYGRTTAWSKVAGTGDAGATVRVTFSATSKANVVLAAYHGTDPAAPVSAFAVAADPASSTARVTPYSPVADPQSWAVSYWMHGDSTTTALVPPDGVAVRSNGTQTGSGRVVGLLADSAASLPTAPYGGKVATAAVASTTNTTWTVVLRPDAGPAPVNEPPTAAFGADCQDLACTFDASTSTDPENALTSYAWDFGDGTTQTTTGPSTTRTYTAGGTYTARLTVTDAGGLTDTTTTAVTVTGPVPQPSSVAFVGASTTSGTAAVHSVTLPVTVQEGDTVLLFLGIAAIQPITDPAGWQALGTVDGGSARTRVWSKVASATDAGSTVSIPVGASVKGTLTATAYRGAAPVSPVFVGAPGSGATATRVTPVAPVATAGSWAVSYWVHRDSSTTELVPPPGVATRGAGTQTGGGRVTTLVADSGGTVATGTYGGLTATAAAASSHGATWTVILAPAG
jgi:PKD repeat protein